jgi:hypothetical protein
MMKMTLMHILIIDKFCRLIVTHGYELLNKLHLLIDKLNDLRLSSRILVYMKSENNVNIHD